MDLSVYFLFWVVIQFYVIYFAAQIVIPLALGSSVRLISVLFLRCPHLFFVVYFLACLFKQIISFRNFRKLQNQCPTSFTLEFTISACSLIAFIGKIQYTPRYECAFATRMLLLLVTLRERTRKYIYTDLCNLIII